jgi:DNA-binding LytR/AlgR family response regulator
MTLRTLVVDEPLARHRLRTLLKAEPSVEIVAECEDGNAALDAVRRLHPDLIFLDVQMPGLDGFDVIGRRLDPPQFVRIHRSTIVNVDRSKSCGRPSMESSTSFWPPADGCAAAGRTPLL